MEHYGHAMIRKGEWKITNIQTPLREENFSLYHVSGDQAEMHDLKDLEPEKYRELLNEWRKYSSEISLQSP
jgi:arylsulfatase